MIIVKDNNPISTSKRTVTIGIAKAMLNIASLVGSQNRQRFCFLGNFHGELF